MTDAEAADAILKFIDTGDESYWGRALDALEAIVARVEARDGR